MSGELKQKQVLDQQLALSAYLNALLEEPDVAPAAPPPPVVQPEPVQPAPAPPPPAPSGRVVTHAGETPIAVPDPVPEAEPREDGVPAWAASRFQALLFEVAGLTLAVPLIKLKGVVPNDGQLTPMPGHSPLFLGVAPYQGLQSKVVDTARFVLPADRLAGLEPDAGARAGHLVMIDEGRWALACSRIGDVIELDRDAVKWRSANGKRLWLAGTVIEHMCALLDVDQLTRQLVDGMA